MAVRRPVVRSDSGSYGICLGFADGHRFHDLVLLHPGGHNRPPGRCDHYHIHRTQGYHDDGPEIHDLYPTWTASEIASGFYNL